MSQISFGDAEYAGKRRQTGVVKYFSPRWSRYIYMGTC